MNMTSGNNAVFIRPAIDTDIDAIKNLCDQHRKELGFVRRASIEKGIEAKEVLVALIEQEVIGFVHYHHRRDRQTTLYHIAITPPYRFLGIGKLLIKALENEALSLAKTCIVLKCPKTLVANEFYQKLGFSLAKTEPGKIQALNIWALKIAADK